MKLSDPLIRDLRILASVEKARTKRIAAMLRVSFDERASAEIHEDIMRAISDAQIKAAAMTCGVKEIARMMNIPIDPGNDDPYTAALADVAHAIARVKVLVKQAHAYLDKCPAGPEGIAILNALEEWSKQ